MLASLCHTATIRVLAQHHARFHLQYAAPQQSLSCRKRRNPCVTSVVVLLVPQPTYQRYCCLGKKPWVNLGGIPRIRNQGFSCLHSSIVLILAHVRGRIVDRKKVGQSETQFPPMRGSRCCGAKKCWACSYSSRPQVNSDDRDVRDMTVLWYRAVAWERISERDGRLLLTR
jgi:hypothetical protein